MKKYGFFSKTMRLFERSGELKSRGLDLVGMNNKIRYYCEIKDMTNAILVFDQMVIERPNVTTMIHMMYGFATCQNSEKIIEYFDKIKQLKIHTPDPGLVYRVLIESLWKAKRSDLVLHYFDEMRRNGIGYGTYLEGFYLKALCHQKKWDEADLYFNAIVRRSLYHHGILIHYFCGANFPERAKRILLHAIESGIELSAPFFNPLLRYYNNTNEISNFFVILNIMIEKNVTLSAESMCSIFEMMLNSKRPENDLVELNNLFLSMLRQYVDRDKIVRIVKFWLEHDHEEFALLYESIPAFDKMNNPTSVIFLQYYLRIGNVTLGEKRFQMIRKDSDATDMMIKLYLKGRQVKNALDLYKRTNNHSSYVFLFEALLECKEYDKIFTQLRDLTDKKPMLTECLKKFLVNLLKQEDYSRSERILDFMKNTNIQLERDAISLILSNSTLSSRFKSFIVLHDPAQAIPKQ